MRWLESTTAVPWSAARPGEHPVDTWFLAGRVEAVRRLVEHQQARPGQQRGGQPETLSHPEREAPDAVVRDVGEPDLTEYLVDTASIRASLQAAKSGKCGKVLAGAVSEGYRARACPRTRRPRPLRPGRV